MESRANHLLIGSFVLLAIAATFAFVIWLARVQLHENVDRYRIYFEGSVQGLGIGGEVQYRGIRIGTISELALDDDDPSRVGVVVEINKRNPIREGDVASLQYQALTGLATINIDGAAAGSPYLTADPSGALPIVPSKPSGYEQLVESAPRLFRRGIVLVDRASMLLREENQVLVTAILQDVGEIVETLASRRESIAGTLDALEVASGRLADGAGDFQITIKKLDTFMLDAEETLAILRSTLESAEHLVEDDSRVLIADLRKAARSVDRLAVQANAVLSRNSDSIDYFANDVVIELSRFLTESRLLVASFSRIVERLETDGARFLIGEPDAEFRAK